MNYEISKELFEAVMNIKTERYNIVSETACGAIGSLIFEDKMSLIYYSNKYGNNESRYIPIETFFFKCKEWAQKNRFDIQSQGGITARASARVYRIATVCKYSCRADTEQQAVFEATSWVLEQVKNNK